MKRSKERVADKQSQSASELRHSATLGDKKRERFIRCGRCVINSVRLLIKQSKLQANCIASLSPKGTLRLQ